MKNLKDWNREAQKIEEALRLLHIVAVNAGLYTNEHPKFQETLNQCNAAWDKLLSQLEEVELKQVGQDLIYEDIALQGSLNTTSEFAKGMKERGMECLIFKRGLTLEELVEYAHYMRLNENMRKQKGEASLYFRKQGVRHIEIWKLSDMSRARRKSGLGGGFNLPISLDDLSSFRKGRLDAIGHIHKEAKVSRDMDMDVVQALVGVLLNDCAEHSSLMLGISSIKGRDEYTCTHSLNTCILASSLASYINLSEEIMPVLGISALLHDIGKMFVPDSILNKPGKLTPEEWVIMEHHTTYGARFLMTVPNLPALAPLVAYEHHMTLGGSGYPRPKRPYNINMASLMLSIADFYDALSTARSYKKAVPPAKVVQILEDMEDQRMEPQLRELFLGMVGKYPIGTVVRLDTDELGVVSMQNNEEPLRPEVYLVAEPDGRKIDEYAPVNLDEKNNGGPDYARSIVEAVDPLDVEVDPLEVLQKALK